MGVQAGRGVVHGRLARRIASTTRGTAPADRHRRRDGIPAFIPARGLRGFELRQRVPASSASIIACTCLATRGSIGIFCTRTCVVGADGVFPPSQAQVGVAQLEVARDRHRQFLQRFFQAQRHFAQSCPVFPDGVEHAAAHRFGAAARIVLRAFPDAHWSEAGDQYATREVALRVPSACGTGSRCPCPMTNQPVRRPSTLELSSRSRPAAEHNAVGAQDFPGAKREYSGRPKARSPGGSSRAVGG